MHPFAHFRTAQVSTVPSHKRLLGEPLRKHLKRRLIFEPKGIGPTSFSWFHIFILFALLLNGLP